MDSWEKAHQIVVFFQTFPRVNFDPLGFMVTVKSRDLGLYQQWNDVYDNPEIKADAFGIMEEVTGFLKFIHVKNMALTIFSSLYNADEEIRSEIFGEYVYPAVKIINENWKVDQIVEQSVDLFTLNNMYSSKFGKLYSEVLNLVLYVAR